ncbi:MAG: hypothetical protein JXR48_10700 [Candidatus Delongbacteria bacterium]|nr:hypothetical protein [Candidatus Delongbacteria bacterium]MBN2835421.1 hypothetical protein [Candidatus Delongbacteria bacterium]
MKTVSSLIFFFFSLNLFSSQVGSIFDIADNGRVQKSKTNEKITLREIESIKTFKTSNGDEVELSLDFTAIDYESGLISTYSQREKTFYQFNLSDFGNGSEIINVVNKNVGDGPDDIRLPMGMVFNTMKKLYYIADLSGRNILVYNQDLIEVDRIKLLFSPFKITTLKNRLFVSRYHGVESESGHMGIEINLDTKEISELFEYKKNTNEYLEQFLQTVIKVTPIDDTFFYVVRDYPRFNVYKCDKEKVVNTFTSSKLANVRLPKPEQMYINGNKHVKSIVAFKDTYYSKGRDLLFYLTTDGSSSLVKELDLSSYILIFDGSGQLLAEWRHEDYTNNERTAIIYDEVNNYLYFFAGDEIKKFELVFN